jgi:hypothetical protein
MGVWLLFVFLVSVVIGQAISIGIGLMVERYTTPYNGSHGLHRLLFHDVLAGLAFRRSRHQTARAPGGLGSG